MPRNVGMVRTAIWVDEDFLALSAGAQRLYLLLISQPEINNAGLLDFTPRRWARLAPDSTAETVEAELTELETARFVLVDRDTEELLVRTFVRYDRAESNVKLRQAARGHFLAVQSRRLQRELVESFGTVFGDLNGADLHKLNPWGDRASHEASHRSSDEVSDAQSSGPRAYARPHPQPHAAKRGVGSNSLDAPPQQAASRRSSGPCPDCEIGGGLHAADCPRAPKA